MFCFQCGCQTAEADNFCGQCGTRLRPLPDKANAAKPTDKAAVLTAIAEGLAQNPQLTLTFRQKTDIEVAGTLATANWTIGKKTVSYCACILADEPAHTIVFWEMLKESGCGLGPLFSVKTETYRSDGKTISGTVTESGYGVSGKAFDYQWDYAQIRTLAESIAQSNGWQFTTVLLPGKACY